jgi:ATP-dependent helicase/nuclease subunit B
MNFLDEVAEQLIENHGSDLKDIAVILPSKRASLFLKKSIAARLKTTFWAPQTINFSELVNQYQDEVILDKTSLSFELYEVYKLQEGKNAETFDQFYKWGEILLSDFNDIDLYLLDAKDVFRDLRNIQQLESWDTENHTDMQKKYLGFWAKLAPLYYSFKDHLKQKGYTYSGAVYKNVALQLKLNGINKNEYKQIYFCGLNGISPSEIDIIKTFQKNMPTQIIWDLDAHYVDNPFHEAGHFYRKIKNSHEELNGNKPPSNLDVSTKNITIYESPSNVGQAKIASQILENIAPINSHEKCALVLPDASMLIPVIEELPQSLEQANVTMGFPLDKTEIYSLINHVFNLQDNIQKNQSGSQINFHHMPFLRIIKHPILRSLYREELEAIDIEIKRNNKVFIHNNDLEKLGIYKSCPLLFNKWENFHSTPFEAILSLIKFLKPSLTADSSANKINLEALHGISESVLKLKHVLSIYQYITKLSTFKRVFSSALKSYEMSFYGEPLSGLQIMGLLETRSLDFENLILLSMNEGVVPKGKHDSSILPYDLKRYHDLPGTHERDAVMANHFFRLIQRAKNVHLIYAPVSDGFGPGEKSRFLLQLEQEFELGTIDYKRFATPIGSTPDQLSVEKNALYFNELENYMVNKGLSVSAINKFIRCPLDFYYSYICGLKEDDSVEEDIEDSTMGSLIHEVLEDIYEPFIDSYLTEESLKLELKRVRNLVETKFSKKLNQKNLNGHNYISKEIAITQVEKVLQLDIKEIKAGVKILLLGTEKEIKTEFTHDFNGKLIQIKLSGNVDRIDERNGEIRVIDYKTGGVSKDSVPKLNLEAGLDGYNFSQKTSKSLQLAYYSYIYGKSHPEKKVTSWIFAIRNTKEITFQGVIKGGDSWGEEFRTNFEQALDHIISNISDPNSSLQHSSTSDYCRVC